MEAEDRDAGAAHVAQRGAVVLDLLVAAGPAEHRLVVEMDRHVLDRLQHEPVLRGLVDERAKVRLLPMRLARAVSAC